MKKVKLTHVSDCSKAINTLQKQLEAREKVNKQYRLQIASDWSDRTRDEELQVLHQLLSDGRKEVRAYQTALHELKIARKDYNASYDAMCKMMYSSSSIDEN